MFNVSAIASTLLSTSALSIFLPTGLYSVHMRVAEQHHEPDSLRWISLVVLVGLVFPCCSSPPVEDALLPPTIQG